MSHVQSCFLEELNIIVKEFKEEASSTASYNSVIGEQKMNFTGVSRKSERLVRMYGVHRPRFTSILGYGQPCDQKHIRYKTPSSKTLRRYMDLLYTKAETKIRTKLP